MKRANPLFNSLVRSRVLLVVTVLIVLPAMTGCTPVFLANGTGRTLIFKVNDTAIEIPPSRTRVHFGQFFADPNVDICTPDGNLVFSNGSGMAQSVNTYDGFGMFSGPSFGSPGFSPDLSVRYSVLLCNESPSDVLIVPVSPLEGGQLGSNEVSAGWQVSAGQVDEFSTVATGLQSFEAYDAAGASHLVSCSIDLSDYDQVIWDGINLTCKEAVIIQLVNNSSNGVDIVWLEGKGFLRDTTLAPGVSIPIGVPQGEVANFNALTGTILENCTLSDPMAGDQIVWDGTQLTPCETGPPDPPEPPQTVTIAVHNNDPGTVNLGPAWFVIAGDDPISGVFVFHGQSGVLEVPIGAPVDIEVWDGEAAVLYGQCPINDPTVGDSVSWDGTNVSCEDL